MSGQAQASPAAKPAIDVASLVAASATGDVNAVRSCLLPVHDAPSSCESWRQRPVAVAVAADAACARTHTLIQSNSICSAVHELLLGTGASGALIRCASSDGPDEDAIAGRKQPLKPSSEPSGVILISTRGGRDPCAVAADHPEALLRSLLLIPSHYSTPWLAAIDAIRSIRSGQGIVGRSAGENHSAVLSFVVEIGIFLDGVAFNPGRGSVAGEAGVRGRCGGEEEIASDDDDDEIASDDDDERDRAPMTEQSMLSRIFDLVIEPLFIPSCKTANLTSRARLTSGLSGDTDKRRLEALLSLMPALFGASTRLEGGKSPLVDATLLKLFPSSENEPAAKLNPSMVVSILAASPSLELYCTANCWANFRQVIRKSLANIPQDDLPYLARGIVRMISKGASDRNESTLSPKQDPPECKSPSWPELLAHIYEKAALLDSISIPPKPSNTQVMTNSNLTSRLVLPSVESAISSSLASVSLKTSFVLLENIQLRSSTSSIPTWVLSNVIILVFHAHSSSGLDSLRQLICNARMGPMKMISRRNQFVQQMDIGSFALRALVDDVQSVGLNEDFVMTDALTLSGLSRYFSGASYLLSPGKRKDEEDRGGSPRAMCSQYEILLEKYENLLQQSIFLSDEVDWSPSLDFIQCENEQLAVCDRAARFLQAGTTSFEQSQESHMPEELKVYRQCFAIASFRSIFYFLSSSRPRLVEVVASGLSSSLRAQNSFYCIVLSALVEKALALTSSHGTAEEITGVGSSLRPVATLLSSCRGGPSADKLSGNSVPREIILAALFSLSFLPTCRDAMLAEAKKHIPFQSNVSSKPSSCYIEVHSESDVELPISIEILCILIRQSNASHKGKTTTFESEPDEYSCEALAALSNLIVLGGPFLRRAVRGGLYQKLVEMAASGSLNEWSISRLRNACLCRLLGYFGVEDENNDLQCGSKDNILLFAPNQEFSSWTENGERDAGSSKARSLLGPNLNEDLPKLVRVVLTLSNSLRDPDAIDSSYGREISRYLTAMILETVGHDCFPPIDTEKEESLNAPDSAELVKQSLGAILASILDPAFSNVVDMTERQEIPIDVHSCVAAKKSIAHIEIAAFTEGSQPYWTKHFSLETTKIVGREPSAESNEDTPCAVLTPQLRSGLAATLLEAVLYPLEETSPMSCYVDRMHATNLIIDAARFPEEARPDEQSGEETEEESGITISFGKDFSAALFRCSVPFLKAFPIVFDTVTKQTEGKGKLYHCGSIGLLLQAIKSWSVCIDDAAFDNHPLVELSLILPLLWSVYLSAASENGACKLILVLDKRLLNASGGMYLQDSNCRGHRGHHLKIESHDDIDEIVRKMRYSILSTLEILIRRRSVGKREESIDLKFWANMIAKLGSDLYDGLHGKSGGISRDIFMSYLNIIQLCVGIVLGVNKAGALPCGATSDVMIGVLDDCWACSSNLWNILCKFELDHQAKVFKKLLNLLLIHLRDLRGHIHYMAPSVTLSNGSESAQANLLSMAANECIKALDNGSRSIPKAREKRENVNFSKKKSNVMDKSLPPLLDILQVKSLNAWSWTQAIVFNAAENTWSKSYHYIKSMTGVEIRRDAKSKCFSLQQQELLVSLTSISEFLTEGSTEDNYTYEKQKQGENIDQENKDKELLAERLPPSSKQRLALVLERVAATLKLSTRYILSLVKEATSDSKKDTSATCRNSSADRGNRALSESLACLCAWIDGPKVTCSFTSGARVWYAREKARYRIAKARAKAGGCHIDQDPILGRLPKALFQMEELEISFQKLAEIVFSTTKKKVDFGKDAPSAIVNHSRASLLLASFDDVLANLASSVKYESSYNFLEMVKVHLKSLTSSSSPHLSSFDMALIAFEDKEDELISGESVGAKRKRYGRTAALAKHLREKRRNVLRSRNEVVDEWLGLDASHTERVGTSMDAFVDLEDFLVEG